MYPLETYGEPGAVGKRRRPCDHGAQNHSARRELGMPEGWRQTRKTFRHGNLAEALVAAALTRLEADGTEALSLRKLARDAGVNHRAVYRHFPDKLALLARVAEEGWRLLDRRVRQQIGN